LRGKRRPRVFENIVLRKIFGPKRDEVTGDWRRLRNEELHDQCSSPNIIWAIKSRRVRWTEHVACREDRRDAYRILVGRPDGKDHLEDTDTDRSIILKCIFKKWNGEAWTGLIWLRIGTGGGRLCMQ
jgi:hypothetical protein